MYIFMRHPCAQPAETFLAKSGRSSGKYIKAFPRQTSHRSSFSAVSVTAMGEDFTVVTLQSLTIRPLETVATNKTVTGCRESPVFF